jgi:hypothetical protein
VLRTRSPLIPGPKSGSPFDLHVLSTPPAFVLSQDQTLRREMRSPGPEARGFISCFGVRPAVAGTAQADLPSIPPVMSGRFQYYSRLARHGEPAARDGV